MTNISSHDSTICRPHRMWWGTHNIENIELRRKKLFLAALGSNHDADYNSLDRVRGVSVHDSSIEDSSLGPALLERCTVFGIKGDIICWGTLFRGVSLVGDFDNIMIQGLPHGLVERQELVKYSAMKERFYSGFPVAIDISEINCKSFSVRNSAIPLHLIVRDEKTQFILNDSQLSQARRDWAENLSPLTRMSISTMREENSEELLLVAPKRDRATFNDVINDIRLISEKTGIRVGGL